MADGGWGLKKFPIGIFSDVGCIKEKNLPGREILLISAYFSRIISRSGNMMLTPEQFGAAIRSARKAQGMRQDQLAGAAGVGVRFIVDLEAGKSSTQLGKALAVASALGLNVSISGPGAKR